MKTNYKMKSKKYVIYVLMIITISTLLFLSTISSTYGAILKESISLTSESSVLLDPDTNTVLFEKDMNRQIYPASTIKVLTALIAVEKGNLDDEITVSENAMRGQENGGTHVGLNPGEKLTLKDALYGMMLESANDAAIAIAEHISGSVEKFAELMNKRAKELGAKNSHFVNPHGLFEPDHYTTAYDMALIASKAMKNKEVFDMMSARTYQMAPTNFRADVLNIYPTHKMFPHKSQYYENFVAGKTGYTEESKRNLITIAEKDNKKLLTYMATNASNQGIYDDTKNMFNFAFDNFENVDLNKDKNNKTFKDLYAEENALFKKSVKDISEKITSYLPKDYDEKNISFKIENKAQLPIKKGDIIGAQLVYYNDELVGKENIVAEKDISTLSYYASILLKILLYLLVIIIILFIILIFIRNRNLKKRKKKLFSKKY